MRRGALLALLLYTLLALVYLRPVWARFGTHVSPFPSDPVLNLYLLEWGAHQIRQGLPSFWDAPFFHPTLHVVTLSDHLLGPALFTAGFTTVVPNPVAAYNALFLSSYLLCGLAAWAVLRWSGLGMVPALFGGAAYAFSSFRWDQTPHLQILLAQWIPLTLWSFDRLLAERTWRRAGLFLLCYLLHLSGGLYLAYMIHVPLAVLLANRLGELRTRRDGWRPLLVACALAALGVAAVFAPYLAARIERPEETLRDYGATLLSYFTPSWSNLYAGSWLRRLHRIENCLFAGFLPTVLAAMGLAEIRRRSAAPFAAPLSPGRRLASAGLLALAAAGLVLADLHTWAGAGRYARLASRLPFDSYEEPLLLLLAGAGGWLLARRLWGGAWGLRSREDPWPRGLVLSGAASLALSLPVVYSGAREVLPGLDGMRVPSRFYPFVSLALAYLAARGLSRLLDRIASPAGRRVAGAAVLALLALELAPRPLPWTPVPRKEDFPPVYAWLAGQSEVKALLELPWHDPGVPWHVVDLAAMYHGTRHWKPLVNGSSGFFPSFYQGLRRRCCWPVPDGEVLDELRRAGVTHVLVHAGRLRKRWQRRELREWEQSGEVALVYSDENKDRSRVYRILSTSRSARAKSAAPGTAP